MVEDTIISRVERIHMVGIGGVGMSGLALLLKDKGYTVSGSDLRESFYLQKIRECGIKVFIGHNKKNLQGVDLVCYSSAVKEDNVEILYAKEKGIPLIKRGQLLSLVAGDKKVIAISGSHGKTTTSALITYLLNSLGYKPAAFIGAYPLNYHRTAWWGEDFFVMEMDESDGSFNYCTPWIAVITNIDKEHLDFYKSEEQLKKSFLQFALASKELTIGWGDSPQVAYILDQVKSLRYGFCPSHPIRAENIYFDGSWTYFDLILKDKKYSKVKSPLIGEHNILNTLGALSFFYYLNEDMDKVLYNLRFFKSTKRRLEVKARIGGVTFVDDYAHHPTEIKWTLKSARLLNPKRLVALFQPHRYSRIELLNQEFSKSFSLCDCLIVTDIYPAGEVKPKEFRENVLWESIKTNFSGDFFYIPKQRLLEEVPFLLSEGDLVLSLGAGDITTLFDGIIEEFRKHRVKV